MSFSNRLENLEKEKKYYLNKLKAINPNIQLGNVDKLLRIEIAPEKLNKNDNIELKSTANGIEITSTLSENEHRYIFMVDKKQLSLIRNFLSNSSNQRLSLKFLASKNNSMEVELHLILLLKNNERMNVKVTPENYTEFIVPQRELIEGIKLAIRVKGSGFAYIHCPYIYSQDVKNSIIKNKKANKKAKKIKDMNVIFIGDEFTTRAFEPEFNLIKVTPDKWEEELKNVEPDFFLCESAWVGNDGAWNNKVGTKGPRNNNILLQLVRWCNEKGIPTVFWNKEDPFHYQVFIETAQHFDYVFTTDSNSIPKYEADGCKNVFSFPFAAQPVHHNPIEKYDRINKVVFAGAYYGEKFPDRKQVMDNMIEVSGEYGLEIYDRNYNNPDSPNKFPDEFKSYIVGTLKGDEIEIAYKGYKLALNVNSIVDSPTMFARRVFEVIASNTPVISSKSLGINNLFGDLVVASNDFNVLQSRVKKYFEDEYYYKTNRLQGLRKVLMEHTYLHRIQMMLGKMGIPYIEDSQLVTVVGIVRSPKEYDELMKQYKRQEWKEKRLVILLDIFEGYLNYFNNNNNNEVKTYLMDYLHNYSSLNDIIETDYFAVFDNKNYYGENYLTDMILATQYVTDSHIVKDSGEEYTFTTRGKICESLIKKELTGILKPIVLLDIIENSDKHVLSDWFKYGARFFNIDSFNFIHNYKGKKNIKKKIEKLTI